MKEKCTITVNHEKVICVNEQLEGQIEKEPAL